MFDTHAPLNFSRFKKNVGEVIARAKEAGVDRIVVPGTDIPSSKKAIELTEQYKGLYAAVGIHPHHGFEVRSKKLEVRSLVQQIATMLSHPKVVAVGEIGMDRHSYGVTKYDHYDINDNFIAMQRQLFVQQIKLAVKHHKSLIIHNREATKDVLAILTDNWDDTLAARAVFHCCQPDERLLSFAKEHQMYIGVDGDITYDTKKQQFIKHIPTDMLVIETDSPFLLPEPLKSQKNYPNEPKNVRLVAERLAELFSTTDNHIADITKRNANRLFGIN